jgi:hypothetical protein
LQAKTLCKLGDVGDGIAIGQAGELVQWEHDLLDERTECRVLPNANTLSTCVLASPSASFAHSMRVAVPVVCEINRNGASVLTLVRGGRRLRG